MPNESGRTPGNREVERETVRLLPQFTLKNGCHLRPCNSAGTGKEPFISREPVSQRKYAISPFAVVSPILPCYCCFVFRDSL